MVEGLFQIKSLMFNNSSVLAKFRGLLGFESNYNTENTDLDGDMLDSRSGMLIGPGLHPLFSYENLLAVVEQFGTVNVKAWSGSVAYKTGAIVQVSSVVYQAIQDGTNRPPASSPTYWRATTLFSAYMRRMYDNAVLRLLHALFTNKKLHEASKSLLASINLYEGQGNINKRIPKAGRFVGLRLTLQHPDTVARISKIGLQLDTAQTITLYLFHSSSLEPVKTWEINHTNAITFQWHTIPEEALAFMSDTTNAGGHWYIGYYEDDLTGNAIGKEMRWDGTGCGSCSQDVFNRGLWSKWHRFLGIQPFYVTEFTEGEMWNEDLELYVAETNFGINLRMAVQCDVSEWLGNHSYHMADALAKQITVDLLNEMAYSMRDNQRQVKLAGLAHAALDNTENSGTGALTALAKAIKAVDFDFSNLSPLCNPCNDGAMGVRKTSVWGG